MKYIQAIFCIFAFLVSTSALGQMEKTNEHSIAKTALVIDSIENRTITSTGVENANQIFELALLYRKIDPDQSKKYAFQYLKINDSISSVNKRKAIHGLLAHMLEQQGNIDSSFYYLSVQTTLVDGAFDEKSEILKRKYLGNNTSKNADNGLLGLSRTQLVFMLGSIILSIIVLIYFLAIKRQFRKSETKRNQELETANTKFMEFNEAVAQAVVDNTGAKSVELEKSNSTIVELRKSLKKAEESNYLKNAFLSSMSHRIKTPLSGIMGFSNLLETDLAVMGNEELYGFAKDIGESGEKLMSLITNIIDISSIESNILELKISSCNPNEIIREVGNDYLFKAKEKGLVYKTKLDAGLPKIKADADSLLKVLNIIMDNAIKYTDKGFVTISTKHNSNHTATISIKDKGIGIDAETLKMLLASFDYKKHGSSLTYKGQGLGLILAQRLIDLMNGKLEINSEIGIGTEVNITLPCADEMERDEDIDRPTAQKPSMVSAPKYGRIKIFIVEDDRMNRLVLEKMLKKSGDITTAVDGKDTLKIIEKNNKSGKLFDVMLFDINLPPPWDGTMLMHEIKERFPGYKNVPFIAQTAYAMAGDKDLYLDAGFNDYIPKPIIKTELLTMIQKQLEIFGER